MFSETKLQEVKDYLSTAPVGTNVFIGCDSKRNRRRDGDVIVAYTSVVVIHKKNENGMGCGAVVFADTDHKPDYDAKQDRPFMRMMNEAYMATELYQQLEEALLEFDVEMHLDINKDARHGSNVAHNAAVGYVRGITGRPVLSKPDAWAASHVADHGVRGKFKRTTAHAA